MSAVEIIDDDAPTFEPLVPTLAPASPAIRAVIADGQSLVRAGFRLLLEATGRITVVGEAASGKDVVTLARRVRPDVALIDATLPGLDSVETTHHMSSDLGVAVMLLAASGCDERILAALRSGATGLLLKDTEPTELVRAVEALARGEALVSPSITRRLIAEFVSRPEPAHPSPDQLAKLTAREREVLTLVGHGLDNDEIARRLVVTLATAKTHVSRAMVKLGAHDRAKLVVFAYETGLIRPRIKEAPHPDLLLDDARARRQHRPAESLQTEKVLTEGTRYSTLRGTARVRSAPDGDRELVGEK
jgi:DNA-binding NarL/FixJ family response regulator